MNSVTGGTPQRGGAPSPSSASSVSLNTYQFDFDLGLSGRGSSSSRPLKDQKLNPSAAPNPISSSSTVAPKPAAPSWTHQPNKPSWTHQPAPRSGPSNPPASMVGDIYGKSWSSAAPPAATSRIGIPDNNPRLFGDLVGSALGQSKAGVGGNAPLKASAPRNSYSMGSLSDSLPKATNTAASSTANPSIKPSSASVDNLRNYSSANQAGSKIGNPLSGGPPLKSSSAAQMNPKKDPFGSLLDFGSKPTGNPPLSAANSANSGNGGGADYSFGSFQNAKMDEFVKPDLGFSAPPANSSNSGSSNGTDYSFGAFKNAKTDGFGSSDQSFSTPTTQQQPAQTKGDTDPLDVLFSSPISSAPAAAAPSGASGGPPFSEMNDWDLGSEFGGNDTGGGTTELEGLPPPPAGVTVSAAKTKGLDNYKQGQFADAIKWLSWAVVLLEKSGGSAAGIEILSCRASCYKEVGEYKKAVADCSKVLEHDSANVSVLLQRALLYESTEKYKLGAEDLRMVLKIDPGNRLARSTIHRLNKLAG